MKPDDVNWPHHLIKRYVSHQLIKQCVLAFLLYCPSFSQLHTTSFHLAFLLCSSLHSSLSFTMLIKRCVFTFFFSPSLNSVFTLLPFIFIFILYISLHSLYSFTLLQLFILIHLFHYCSFLQF